MTASAWVLLIWMATGQAVTIPYETEQQCELGRAYAERSLHELSHLVWTYCLPSGRVYKQ